MNIAVAHALRGNGQQLMIWLRDNNWPRDRYQLLCSNCNQGKVRNGGVCPHVTKAVRNGVA